MLSVEHQLVRPMGLSLKEQQHRKIKTQSGFLAALDQSGGSTPKALQSYGIKENVWSNARAFINQGYRETLRAMDQRAARPPGLVHVVNREREEERCLVTSSKYRCRGGMFS